MIELSLVTIAGMIEPDYGGDDFELPDGRGLHAWITAHRTNNRMVIDITGTHYPDEDDFDSGLPVSGKAEVYVLPQDDEGTVAVDTFGLSAQKVAGILHRAAGTLGDVAYAPESCSLCEKAKALVEARAETLG